MAGKHVRTRADKVDRTVENQYAPNPDDERIVELLDDDEPPLIAATLDGEERFEVSDEVFPPSEP